MYTYSPQELDGLFRSIGKIAKGAVKVVGKAAPIALGVAAGMGPAGAILAASGGGGGGAPYTGAGGVAMSAQDMAYLQAAQSQYVPPYAAGQVDSGLPNWVIPAAVVGGLALVFILMQSGKK